MLPGMISQDDPSPHPPVVTLRQSEDYKSSNNNNNDSSDNARGEMELRRTLSPTSSTHDADGHAPSPGTATHPSTGRSSDSKDPINHHLSNNSNTNTNNNWAGLPGSFPTTKGIVRLPSGATSERSRQSRSPGASTNVSNVGGKERVAFSSETEVDCPSPPIGGPPQSHPHPPLQAGMTRSGSMMSTAQSHRLLHSSSSFLLGRQRPPSFRELMQMALEAHEREVMIAATGRSAREFDDNPFGVVPHSSTGHVVTVKSPDEEDSEGGTPLNHTLYRPTKSDEMVTTNDASSLLLPGKSAKVSFVSESDLSTFVQNANMPTGELEGGPLMMVVERAWGLRNADWGVLQGVSDPYVQVSVPGKPQLSFTTKVIDNCLEPVWNHKFVLSGLTEDDTIYFLVMDKDYSSDELLGRCTLSGEQAMSGFDGEIELDEAGEGHTAFLKISIRRVHPPSANADPEEALWPEWTEVPKCLRMPLGKHSATDSLVNQAFESPMMFDRQPTFQDHEAVRMPNRLMHPESPRRIWWDLLGFLVLVSDLVWLPMQVFSPPPNRVQSIFTAVYWTIDIMATANTAQFTQDGTVIMSRRQLMFQYLKTWLLVDITLVVIDWYVITMVFFDSQSTAAASSGGFARSAKLARMTRVMRLLRLMRLLKLRKLLFGLQEFVQSESLSIVLAVAKNLGVILCMNHILACLWYWVGTFDGDHGWVALEGLEDLDYGTLYLICMNWSLAQFTPGASNVQPSTSVERIYTISILAVGMVFSTVFVSSITSTMSAVWTLNRFNNTQHVLLKKFLHQQRVSRTLASRITRYVDFVLELRHKRVHSSKVHFLTLLSGPLHIELLTELHAPVITDYFCFAQVGSMNMATMREICATASINENFAKNDMVFNRGAEAKRIMFLTLGTLVYRHRSHSHLPPQKIKLDKGQWFVEPVLYMPWKHVGEMKALTEADTVSVVAAKFRDIVMNNRDVFLVTRGYAFAFWLDLQENLSQTDPIPVTDVVPRMAHRPKLSRHKSNLTDEGEVKQSEDIQTHIVQWDD